MSTIQTLPKMFDSADENMCTPVSSRSSSATSLASSISPTTPLARHQKRLKEKDADAERKTTPCKKDLEKRYQQLMTKYYKAKKMIHRLKDQNKHHQRRISLLEFSRQQEAVSMQLSESEMIESQEQGEVKEEIHSESKNECGTNGVVDDNIEGVINPDLDSDKENCVVIENEPDKICDNDYVDIGNVIQCNSGHGHGIKGMPCVPVYPDLNDELVKRVAAVISDQSLRPIIFNVALESPPNKMTKVIETLSKAGRCCQRCGKKMDKKAENV